MNCRDAEKLMSRAKDFVLAGPVRASLEAHLRDCPRCRRADEEYRGLFLALRPTDRPGPATLSWTRLRARIEEREAAELNSPYEKWALKAIPAAVTLALLIGSASVLFRPARRANLSPTEELLLSNTNPLVEARTILDQQKLEDRGLMLIFASNEARPPEGK
jgi:hypothetical protein